MNQSTGRVEKNNLKRTLLYFPRDVINDKDLDKLSSCKSWSQKDDFSFSSPNFSY